MTPVIVEVLFIAVLIAANGLLAMSELAIVSARKVRLKQMAQNGVVGAEIALQLTAEPNRFLSTIQIGITLVGILAGAFAGATVAEHLNLQLAHIPTLAPYSKAISITAVVLAITYFSLVFGELVPKRLALSNAERIAARVAKPMKVLSIIGAPVVHFLSVSTEAVLRILGAKSGGDLPVTEDEIRMLIRQGTAAGVFEEAEEDLVENVFRFADSRVSALMTPRWEIVALDIADSLEVNQRKIAESAHSRFPVYERSLDNVHGVARAKDLLARQMEAQPFDLRVVTHPALFVPEGMRALRVLELFKKTGRHLAIVVDEHGGTEGLITHHDILEAFAGDITVIGETLEPEIVQREDGSWLVDGSVHIYEFKGLMDLRGLPGEEDGTFQTLAGFIMSWLGRIPSVGEHFEWNGLRFEVVDMDGRRIDKVLVTRIENTKERE